LDQRVEQLVRSAHEKAKEEAVRAEAGVELATQIAKAPPPDEGEPRLTYEQEEKLSGLILRADSFVDAYTALEDAPKEWIGDEDHRRRIMGILSDAHEAAEKEACRYKEELGLE